MCKDLFENKNSWEKYTTSELSKSLPSYFEWSGDIEHSAYLNWRFNLLGSTENKFYEMGIAYFETAIVLIDKCIENNLDKKADGWIFPILFNVVHGIEIFLKGFNSQIKILEKIEKQQYQSTKIEGNHDIKQLCEIAISLIKKSSQKGMLPEFQFVKKFIYILYANTADMTFARYPVDRNKNPHFYINKSDNITIDLDVLRIWVCKIFSILNGCTGFVDFQIDEIKEWIYEMQQEYGEEIVLYEI